MKTNYAEQRENAEASCLSPAFLPQKRRDPKLNAATMLKATPATPAPPGQLLSTGCPAKLGLPIDESTDIWKLIEQRLSIINRSDMRSRGTHGV